MKKRAFIYVILAGILWGTSGVFFNLLEPLGFSAVQMTAMRGGVSGIVMVIYALFHRELFKVKLKELVLFSCSGLCVFSTAACYFASIGLSSVSTAVVLMYTAPVFVVVYSVAFLGERFNALKLVSVALMIFGCALVSGIIGGIKFNLWGIVFGLLSGISYGAYNIFTRISMMHKSNSGSATLYCFVVMGIVAFFSSNPPQMAELTMKNPIVALPLIIGIGIVTCVMPYFLYTMALRDIPAGTASALSIIEPMAATVFSVIFFDERLGIFPACGIVLILVAVILLNRNNE